MAGEAWDRCATTAEVKGAHHWPRLAIMAVAALAVAGVAAFGAVAASWEEPEAVDELFPPPAQRRLLAPDDAGAVNGTVVGQAAAAVVVQPPRGNTSDNTISGAIAIRGPGGEAAMPRVQACVTAMPGELCHRLVVWAVEDGLRRHPERYPGLTQASSFTAFQAAIHKRDPEYCPRPCEQAGGKVPPPLVVLGSTMSRGCDFGHRGGPAHAGCFVVGWGRLLAVRLTYDGHRFDIPGGRTNWHEPSACTAHRETLEETGYLVAPRGVLAVVRNNFHIYRCELLRGDPIRGHDHEVSWVGWLSWHEVRERLWRNQWRFPEAHRYLEWLR